MFETTGAEVYPHSSSAALNLETSRIALAKKLGAYAEYTPASPGHYWGLHYWDQVFHSVIDARHGSPDSLVAARLGMLTLLKGQEENGFIPNFQDLGPSRRIELERTFGYDTSEHSNYSQPPVVALGLAEVYKALKNQKDVEPEAAAAEALDFLTKEPAQDKLSMYDAAKLAYNYIDEHDSVSPEDRRMITWHPHATGRDSDPTYDFIKPYRIPRNGLDTPWYVDKLNTVLDYGQIIYFSNKLRQAGLDKERAKELFGVCDLMMNCMLVDNLGIMAELAKELGKEDDVEYFTQYATDVEDKIQEKMYVPEARAGRGGFYSTNNEDKPIYETSINNLAPLVLPNLTVDQLDSLVEMMDESFNVPYPLPSVGTTSRNYDPHYSEFERLWRGPTWINMNWYYVERGLKKQLTRPEVLKNEGLAFRIKKRTNSIVFSSLNLLHRNGPREFYNSIKGTAQRFRTKQFGWSNLGYVFLPTLIEPRYIIKSR